MFLHVTLVVCVLKSTDKTIIGVKQNVKESIDERLLLTLISTYSHKGTMCTEDLKNISSKYSRTFHTFNF